MNTTSFLSLLFTLLCLPVALLAQTREPSFAVRLKNRQFTPLRTDSLAVRSKWLLLLAALAAVVGFQRNEVGAPPGTASIDAKLEVPETAPALAIRLCSLQRVH
jgi:hypothetical protein